MDHRAADGRRSRGNSYLFFRNTSGSAAVARAYDAGMRRLLLLLLVLFVAHSARAQVLGTVRVTLRDAQDLALPGATVTLKAEGSTWTQTTTADGQGEAAFIAVPMARLMLTSPDKIPA